MKTERREQRKQLAIICAVRSGLITAYQSNKNLPAWIIRDIMEADRLMKNAKDKWGVSAFDENTVTSLLQVFQTSLRVSGLNNMNDLITTIALSQTALDYLRDSCPPELRKFVEPVRPLIDGIGGHLHDGVKEKYLVEKFKTADLILDKLYSIIGFEG